jgi:hypothetical protein
MRNPLSSEMTGVELRDVLELHDRAPLRRFRASMSHTSISDSYDPGIPRPVNFSFGVEARALLGLGIGVLQSSLNISFRFGGDLGRDTGVSGGERNCPDAGEDERNNDDPDDGGRLSMCDLVYPVVGIARRDSESREPNGGVINGEGNSSPVSSVMTSFSLVRASDVG